MVYIYQSQKVSPRKEAPRGRGLRQQISSTAHVPGLTYFHDHSLEANPYPEVTGSVLASLIYIIVLHIN